MIVTIFGSGQIKEGETGYEEARLLGRKLAEAGYTICNGGYGGMMEASARGAKEGGGQTIGVTTEDFGGPANRWIDKEIRMKRWSERLFKLIEKGDAYVVFDGGTGTLVELFTVWEMSNKKFLKKPFIILGKQMADLVGRIQRMPRVIPSSCLCLAKTPDGVVELLKEKTGCRH